MLLTSEKKNFFLLAMANLESLKIALRRLNLAIQTRKKVSVVNTAIMKKLVKVIEEEKLIKVKNINSREIIIETTREAIAFYAIENAINASRNDLLKLASVELPSITGNMLLTTRRGIMTHHEAISLGIGGMVFGVVY